MQTTEDPPTSSSVHLNDCRQCGSYAVIHDQKGIPGIGTTEYIVVCSTCTKKSSWKPSQFEAARDWNQKNKVREKAP